MCLYHVIMSILYYSAPHIDHFADIGGEYEHFSLSCFDEMFLLSSGSHLFYIFFHTADFHQPEKLSKQQEFPNI